MKRVIGLSAVCFALISPRFATAAGGNVGLFDSVSMPRCTIRDAARVNVYVLHRNTDGSQGVRYIAVPAPCAGWVWVCDTNNFPATGDSQSGIEVAYGRCFGVSDPSIHVQTITFAGGSLQTCCASTVRPHPGDANVLSARCSGGYELANGTTIVARPQASPAAACPCGINVTAPGLDAKWGTIKELFAGE